MKNQAGFTLIELVVVIVILGILAATALPRFINLGTDARIAAVNGIAGGLRSSIALAQARYLVDGDNTSTSINMNGQAVTVVAGSGLPTGDAAGIGEALQVEGLTPVYAAVSTFTPNGGNATCRAEYTVATGEVDAIVSNC